MSSTINLNQTGFIKNRFIGENICFVLESISYYKKLWSTCLSSPGGLREGLWSSWMGTYTQLSNFFFNFNDSFIRWVTILYSNASACVCNNGFSSAFFRYLKGLSRVVLFSPYSFIICAEILAIRITNSSIIRGSVFWTQQLKFYNMQMTPLSCRWYFSKPKWNF